MIMTEHTQITMIKDRDTDMSFRSWINYLKLRFQTRQWSSSLDQNSYVVHFTQCGTANGITVDFPFSLGEESFVKRMGTAMSSLYLWWFNSSHFPSICCPDSCMPDETYWVIMCITEENYYFNSWVNLIAEYFDDNGWQHNINDDHEIIYDKSGTEVGIYVTMPYAMTFARFLERMEGKLGTINYVTKTTYHMDVDDLTSCYSNGFFNQLCDGELY